MRSLWSDFARDLSLIPPKLRFLVLSRIFDLGAASGLVTIVGKQVYDMTGEEWDLGLLGLVEFLPTLVLVPFAGQVADRFDRRVLSAVFTAALLLVAVGLFLYIRTDPTDVGPIFGLMFLYGVLRSFQRPAVRALAVDLSPADIVERVIALSSVSAQGGLIVGPPLAAWLFTMNISLPYIVMAAMFLLSAFSLISLPDNDRQRLVSKSGGLQAFRDAWQGLKFIRNAPVVGAAITLDLFAVLLGGAVALLPAIAEERLGVGATGLGWLRASVAVGAATVTLGLAVKPVARRVGVVLLSAVAVFGVGTIVLGLTRNFWVAIGALVVLGGADSISVFIRTTLVPLATPEDMRGRVLALESVFIGASNELGAFESGATASVMGLVGAVLFGGVGTLVVVGGFFVFVPTLRKIDRFADARATRATTTGG